MHQREKVLRKIKGKEQVVDFVFGSGYLTANPPAIKLASAYKVMSGFGFSIKFSNGKDKKPTYYSLELWGNNAENMARLGFDGQLIEVAGRVTVKNYKSNKGEDKELLVLTVECFTCLERKDKEEPEKVIISKEQTVEDDTVETQIIEDNAVKEQVVVDNIVEKQTDIVEQTTDDNHVGIESTEVKNAVEDEWDGLPF